MKTVQQWPVATAKAKFSELLEQAKSHGPQTVTRHGRPAIVVVSIEDWNAKAQRSKSLAEFITDSPLRGSGVKLRRMTGAFRTTGL